MRIFVGNLSKMTCASHLYKLFLPFGKIKSVKVERDLSTGKSKGIGVIEMEQNIAAQDAIRKLNQINFMNQFLDVRELKTDTFYGTNRNHVHAGQHSYQGTR